MLQFIFGKPASGKTHSILQKIKTESEKGKKCVLIVPEQFSFESERAVLKTLGDKFALSCEVLSFSRISDEVGRQVGLISGKVLSDCDKIIFMKRALDSVKSELLLWGKFTTSISFAKTMLDSVGELKINTVTADSLREIAEMIDKPTLKLKLHDTALIYESYNALITEKFIDPADTLTKLYNTLGDFDYFGSKTVFIDSFKGFTGQQYKLIERIVSQAQDVYVSIVNDPQNTTEYGIFTNVQNVVEKVSQIAKKYAVRIEEPIVLNECRFENEGLKTLEKIISSNKKYEIENDGSVNICCAATVMDEVEFATRTIRKLVREKGYRYRDFVIIARDAEKYGQLLLLSAKKNGVNVFYDNKIPLSAFPLAIAAQSAINTLNFSSENILRFHKTGLGNLEFDEISILENYTVLWNVEGELWQNEWDMNPSGLTDSDKKYDELEQINLLRKKAIEPLVIFKEEFKGNAEQRIRALFKLFESCGSFEKLSEMSERFQNENDDFSGDYLKLAYDEYMNILDSMVTCLGKKSVTTEEFLEILNLAVTLSEVGIIPQTLDQTVFGSADRIRTLRPKVAFILGANQGNFPKIVQNSGVFNIAERKLLIENGINVADNAVHTSIEEEFLVYMSLCGAAEKIYVSYYEQTILGEKAEPSTFVTTLKSVLKSPIIREPQTTLNEESLPETESAAFGEYCKKLGGDKNSAQTIGAALSNSASSKRIAFLQEVLSKLPKSISPETSKQLFGKNIRMSASKFDTFNRCRFSFFCRYGLNASKIQPADFDVMQRGTIVHFVLERFINDYTEKVFDLESADTDSLTESYVNEYLAKIRGFESVRNTHTEFLVSRIIRSLKAVLSHIAQEILQSDFKPTDCELKIGENGSLSFPYEEGEIYLNGSIDRVDKYNGYIRIIDYKTGSKNFKLPDILFGLNLQMLIYLYAVTRAAGIDDDFAAGILYQPSRRNTVDNDMSMNGLLQSDAELYKAMEKSGEGKFIPQLAFNKDGTMAKRSTSYIEKEGFTAIFDHIEKLMKKTGDTISKGDFAVSPLDGRESPACKYCDFSAVCGIENKENLRVPDLKNDQVFEMLKEAEINGI